MSKIVVGTLNVSHHYNKPIQKVLLLCPFYGEGNWSEQLSSQLLGKSFISTQYILYFSNGLSLQFSCSVVSDSSQPHESQHARPPCPSPTPRVYPNSCPSSWWCRPAISSSVIPFSSCPPILPSIWVFSNESTLCMRWPEYWSFSFNIISSKEILLIT